MQLIGTIQERIQQAVEFGRTHRTPQYDEKHAEEIYEKAGVPFTVLRESSGENMPAHWMKCGFTRTGQMRLEETSYELVTQALEFANKYNKRF